MSVEAKCSTCGENGHVANPYKCEKYSELIDEKRKKNKTDNTGRINKNTK